MFILSVVVGTLAMQLICYFKHVLDVVILGEPELLICHGLVAGLTPQLLPVDHLDHFADEVECLHLHFLELFACCVVLLDRNVRLREVDS